jgi:hypothetical protein
MPAPLAGRHRAPLDGRQPDRETILLLRTREQIGQERRHQRISSKARA